MSTSLLLTNIPLLRGVQASTRHALSELAHVHTYQAGESIFLEHESLSTFYIVKSGNVILYKNNVQGQIRTMFVLGQGSLLNEVIFEDLPATVSCKAYETCEIWAFYRPSFLELLRTDFILTQNICNILSNRVRRLYRQLKNATSTTTIEKKLAAKLWKFGRDYGTPCEEGICIDLGITVTSLADLLGTHRETVSRALKVLVSKNLILYESKRLIIIDPDLLALFFKSDF